MSLFQELPFAHQHSKKFKVNKTPYRTQMPYISHSYIFFKLPYSFFKDFTFIFKLFFSLRLSILLFFLQTLSTFLSICLFRDFSPSGSNFLCPHILQCSLMREPNLKLLSRRQLGLPLHGSAQHTAWWWLLALSPSGYQGRNLMPAELCWHGAGSIGLGSSRQFYLVSNHQLVAHPLINPNQVLKRVTPLYMEPTRETIFSGPM